MIYKADLIALRLKSLKVEKRSQSSSTKAFTQQKTSPMLKKYQTYAKLDFFSLCLQTILYQKPGENLLKM